MESNRTGRGVKYRACFLALTSLAMGTFLLFHFAMIWAYGRFYIYEDNRWVLSLETTGMVAILAFSSYCLIEYLREPR